MVAANMVVIVRVVCVISVKLVDLVGSVCWWAEQSQWQKSESESESE